jgi:hypothetical protein
MSDTAVVVREEAGAVQVAAPLEMSIQEVKNQVAKVQTLMRDLMHEGTHYGQSFPGDTKKNLLKPGADKLLFMFRLRPDFDQDMKELPGGHLEVLTRCHIYHIESGKRIADGVGMASTMESKFRWRNSGLKCPICGAETIIKGKEQFGGGWICFAKKGGCGAKFPDGDASIEKQPRGKVENPDIADTYNTVIKMSKKRAYVDATITACAASDIFTQDAEDFTHDDPPAKANPPKQNGADLATQAAAISPEEKAERKEIIGDIGEALTAKNPDDLPWFTEQEINIEREKIKGLKTQGLIDMRNQIYAELSSREERYNDALTVVGQRDTGDGFDDDVPWTEEEAESKAGVKQQDIF